MTGSLVLKVLSGKTFANQYNFPEQLRYAMQFRNESGGFGDGGLKMIVFGTRTGIAIVEHWTLGVGSWLLIFVNLRLFGLVLNSKSVPLIGDAFFILKFLPVTTYFSTRLPKWYHRRWRS